MEGVDNHSAGEPGRPGEQNTYWGTDQDSQTRGPLHQRQPREEHSAERKEKKKSRNEIQRPAATSTSLSLQLELPEHTGKRSQPTS